MMVMVVVMLCRRHLFFYLDFSQSVDIIKQDGFKIPGGYFELSAVAVVRDLAGVFVGIFMAHAEPLEELPDLGLSSDAGDEAALPCPEKR